MIESKTVWLATCDKCGAVGMCDTRGDARMSLRSHYTLNPEHRPPTPLLPPGIGAVIRSARYSNEFVRVAADEWVMTRAGDDRLVRDPAIWSDERLVKARDSQEDHFIVIVGGYTGFDNE